MPNKLQEYRAMAEQAQRQLTGSLERWQSFLTTSARLYKYPYNEQVMTAVTVAVKQVIFPVWMGFRQAIPMQQRRWLRK